MEVAENDTKQSLYIEKNYININSVQSGIWCV